MLSMRIRKATSSEGKLKLLALSCELMSHIELIPDVSAPARGTFAAYLNYRAYNQFLVFQIKANLLCMNFSLVV